ncbi:hypothetical protein Btru_041118 [Bulinus truncatus]|nr:hypothetical protein Btru_041118 [Bulinus truncatus]
MVTCSQVKSTLTYIPNNTNGSLAEVNCSWDTHDHPDLLHIKRNSNELYFTCLLKSNPYKCTRKEAALSKHMIHSIEPGSVTMLIHNIQCLDQASYVCETTNTLEKTRRDFYSHQAESRLSIKVQPSIPKLNFVQHAVAENEEATAVCNVTLGYPRPLQIEWRAFLNGNPFDLSSALLVHSVGEFLPGDDKCTMHTSSIATIKVNKVFQDLRLACFATNQDFQPMVPNTCNFPEREFCNETDMVDIIYPISKIQFSREPSGALFEGDMVTIRCLSDGNPTPRYTWNKAGYDNKTLNGVNDGLSSILTLTNISINVDSGIFICVASNTVSGVTYKLSKSISVSIRSECCMKSISLIMQSSTTNSNTSKLDSNTPNGMHDKVETVVLTLAAIASLVVVVIILMKKHKGTIQEPRVRNDSQFEGTGTEEHTYETIDDLKSSKILKAVKAQMTFELFNEH